MKGVRPPPCWPCQTNSTVWFHSAATGGNKIIHKNHVFYLVWLFDLLKIENILVSERGHLPCWPCRREFCSLVPQRCHLWQQKTIENKTIQSLRGVRPPPLFHAKNVWNVLFDMVYGLMVSCHAMLKILFLVALPQGYITLCYHVTPGRIQPSPNHPFPIPFLLFPCPTAPIWKFCRNWFWAI